MKKSLIIGCGAVIALSTMSGCQTFNSGRNKAAMQQQESYRVLAESNRRLKARMEMMEQDLEQMSEELRSSRGSASQTAQASAQVLNSRMDRIEKDLQNVESRMASDKKEIVNTLTAKITKIMKANASSRPRPTPKAAQGNGYEHVVKSGETLSAIASAYGTTTKAIIRANKMRDADMLRVGQKLFIPE